MRHRHDLVPARDGVRLATDVYLPGPGGPAPAVLHRTPYGKLGAGAVADAEWWAQHGYAAVVQDVRGRHDSDGDWEPYGLHEGPDGHDTIDWIARQPWSTGAVAAAGSSYAAFAAFMAAAHGASGPEGARRRRAGQRPLPPSLYSGGVFSLSRLVWGTLVGRRVQQEVRSDVGPARGVFDALAGEYPDIVLHLPVADIGDRFPMRIPWWREWLAHPTEDAYWRAREDPPPVRPGPHPRLPHRRLARRLRLGPAGELHRRRGREPGGLPPPPDGHVAPRPQRAPGLRRARLRARRHDRPARAGEAVARPVAPGRARRAGRRAAGPPLRDGPQRLAVLRALAARDHDRPAALPARRRAAVLRSTGSGASDGYRYDPGQPAPQPWDFGEWDMPALRPGRSTHRGDPTACSMRRPRCRPRSP